jgi:hypothetical protein
MVDRRTLKVEVTLVPLNIGSYNDTLLQIVEKYITLHSLLSVQCKTTVWWLHETIKIFSLD